MVDTKRTHKNINMVIRSVLAAAILAGTGSSASTSSTATSSAPRYFHSSSSYSSDPKGSRGSRHGIIEDNSSRRPLHETDGHGKSANMDAARIELAMDLHSRYVSATEQVMKGTIQAPVSVFGETLQQERTKANHAYGDELTSKLKNDGGGQVSESRTAMINGSNNEELLRKIDALIGHAENKLYGGSQYHRAVREMFILTHVSHIMNTVSAEEIAQMSGVTEVHDGPDYLRTVAKLALDKTFAGFEEILMYFYERCKYVMKRMYGAIDYVASQQSTAYVPGGNTAFVNMAGYGVPGYFDRTEELNENEIKETIRQVYDAFVEMKAQEALEKCREDLIAMTNFLSWDLMNGGGILGKQKSGNGARKRKDNIRTPMKAIQKDYARRVARGGGAKDVNYDSNPGDDGDLVGGVLSKGDEALYDEFTLEEECDAQDLVQHMLEVANSRSPRGFNDVLPQVMSSLLKQLTWQWRKEFSNLVATKYNCFFVLPFHEEFSSFLMRELDRAYRR